jgi:Phage Tail Collar Domain
MKKCISLLVIFTCTVPLYAQVGFNNPSPDLKSILDLTAKDKGLLIPRITTIQRDGIVSATGATPESLLVYDTDLKGFYFFRSGSWYSLNEWVKTNGSNDVSLTGNATISGLVSTGGIANTGSITNSGPLSTANVTSSGNVSAGSLSVAGFASNALVPTGAIIMWSGTTPPSGWALCDGVAGRPDLRGKFIVGYDPGDADYSSIRNAAGEKMHTLTLAEVPSHNHTITTGGDNQIDDGGGYIQGRNNPDGRVDNTSHLTGFSGGILNQGAPIYDTSGSRCFTFVNGQWVPPGCNPNYGNIIGYQPDFYTTQAFENRPPYYTLAYIIKLP